MNLPTPEKNNDPLTHLIRQEIQASQGAISFARFMELALYAEDLGFYSKNTEKFGARGDFITAPLVSPLFAQCIARQCIQVFATLATHEILEIGAGSGVFARDLLLELEKQNSLPEHYFIFEISASLRTTQQQFLKNACPHLFSRIVWLEALPKNKICGVIFANEVMDALPVTRFCIEDHQLFERSVSFEQDHFIWKNWAASPTLTSVIKKITTDCELPTHYESEVALTLPHWIHSLAHALTSGIILLFDYGYGRREYYHPERSQGTLTCFYQHQKHSDPLIHIGSQDITAHVDFTRVVETAMDANLTFKGYTTQAAFLFATGLMELAGANHLPEIERFQEAQAIKTLTFPSEMGETIKVIGFAKNLDIPLIGFSLLDRSRDL
jgi:SAM-dependent MidA family methyltransferase